jgi:hypothetical protein
LLVNAAAQAELAALTTGMRAEFGRIGILMARRQAF